jgi:hypothetical protein
MPSSPLNTAHVCLVSDHNLPNLVPILEHRPPVVHLLHTSRHKDHSRWLEAAILHDHPDAVVRHHLLGHESDFAVLRTCVQDFAASLSAPCFVNITCGTKPMSLALALVLGTKGSHLLGYVDLRRDVGGLIQYILPSGRSPERVQSHVEMPGRLQMHGYKRSAYRDTPPDEPSISFARLLFSLEEPKRQATIDAMQSFAYRLQIARRSDGLEIALLPSPARERDGDSIDIGEKVGWWTRTADRLESQTPGAFDFARGQWLEEWTAHVLFRDDGRPSPRDLTVYRGLEFTTSDGSPASGPTRSGEPYVEVKNELDVAFVHGNRLTIVECKSVKWAANHADDPESKPAHVLYKLDAVRNRLGGRHAGAVLVCTRKLSEYYEERAKHQGIDIVVFPEMERLRELVTILDG